MVAKGSSYAAVKLPNIPIVGFQLNASEASNYPSLYCRSNLFSRSKAAGGFHLTLYDLWRQR